MKKNENYPKYVQAMKLLDEGRSVQYVVKHLHTSRVAIMRLRPKYLKGGELALLEPQHRAQVSKGRKLSIVKAIEAKGLSLYSAAEVYGIPDCTLGRWIRAYREAGEAGLSRKTRAPNMRKKRQRTTAEMDELEMLRKRNEYLEAENALLKKVRALVEEREARLRAIGRKPSKN